MTPLQFAKAECPNLNNDSCDGMRIGDDLKPLPGKSLNHCLLSKDQRCDHFEQCVLPMSGYVSDPRKSKEYMEAAFKYRLLHPGFSTTRLCPLCKKPIQPRKRLCPDCSREQRRKTIRTAVSKFRQSDVIS